MNMAVGEGEKTPALTSSFVVQWFELGGFPCEYGSG